MKLIPYIMFLLFLSGCATTIKTTVVRAAKHHDAAKFRDLAVLPFDGNAGEKVSYQTEAALAGVSVANSQYFRLADRKQLSTVISEMKLGHSSLVEPGSMAKIGKLAGARAILGALATEQPTETRYREERSECEEYETITGKDGKKKTGNCIRTRRWMVNCVKRQASVLFVPRLVEVESARVIYSRNLQRSRSSSGCLDYSTPETVAELANKAWREVISDFTRDVAPYSVVLELTLSDDDSGIPAGVPQSRFSQGFEFARATRMDRACEIWGELIPYSTSAPFLLYNLGICAEIAGDYDKAADFFKKADRETKEPDENIGKALSRIQILQLEQKKLKEQLGR